MPKSVCVTAVMMLLPFCLFFLRTVSVLCLFCLIGFRSGELRTQKLKSHLVRPQSLNVLPFKPGVGQYIAIHATLTAREFFHAYFYPSSPSTCIFSKTSPNFFPVLACRIGWVTLLDAGSHVDCLRRVDRLGRHDLWKDDDL